MPIEYKELETLPYILKKYLDLNNGEHVLLIDSHIPTLDMFLNHIATQTIRGRKKVYILYRQIFDLIPIKIGYVYEGGESISIRRIFRDEDLIQAIKLLPKEKANYDILTLINPFRYLSEKALGYATTLMNEMIMAINRALPLGKPLLIYNEHEGNEWRICSKIKLIRYDTYIKITRMGNLYIYSRLNTP